jgi:hypothetical protein
MSARFRPNWSLLLWLVIAMVAAWRLYQFDLAVHQFDYGERLYQDYQNSAYFKGDRTTVILSDAQVNAVRGYQLVELGADLEQMLPGHPPFASWLFGLSGRYLGSPLFASLAAVLIAAVFFYLTLKHLLSPLAAQLGLLLFLLEPLLTEQMETTMLDIFLLALAWLGFYTYLRWSESRGVAWLLAGQFALGLALATKFWPAIFPLVLALYLATVASGRFDRFKVHTLALALVGLGFTVGHWQYFLFHPSLGAFISYQRYLISWWAGSPQVPAGQVWDLILANRWHTWWGDREVVATATWWLVWPASIVLAVAGLARLIKTKKLEAPWLALIFWSSSTLLMFSFSATYPRHLLVILPGLYLLGLRVFFPSR